MKTALIAQFGMMAMAIAVPSLSSASAIVTFGGTAVTNEGLVSNVSVATTQNFDNGILPGNYSLTGASGIVQGNLSDVFLQPTNDTSNYLTTGTGTATINLLGNNANYFGLDWGSLDSYNTLTLTESNGTVDTYTGSNIATLSGVAANGSNSVYANFFAPTGETFKSVTLSSSSNAFETDNHAYGAVPEPSTWTMMAGAMLVAGVMFRRRFQHLRS